MFLFIWAHKKGKLFFVAAQHKKKQKMIWFRTEIFSFDTDFNIVIAGEKCVRIIHPARVSVKTTLVDLI